MVIYSLSIFLTLYPLLSCILFLFQTENTNNEKNDELEIALLSILALAIVGTMLYFITEKLLCKISDELMNISSKRIYHKILYQQMSTWKHSEPDRLDYSDVSEKFISSIQALNSSNLKLVANIIVAFIILIASIVVCFTCCWKSGLVQLTFTVIILFIMFIQYNLSFTKLLEGMDKRMGITLNCIKNYEAVALMGCEDTIVERYFLDKDSRSKNRLNNIALALKSTLNLELTVLVVSLVSIIIFTLYYSAT